MGKNYQPPTSKSKKLLIVGAALLSLAIIAFVITRGRRVGDPPPVEKITDEKQAMEVLKTADFSKLSDEQKLAYAEKFRDLRPWGGRGRQSPDGQETLSEEEKQRVRANSRELFRAGAQKRMDDYFALPKEEKTAYLDKMIDEIVARMAEHQKERAEEAKTASPKTAAEESPSPEKPHVKMNAEDRKKRSLARMKELIETTNPEELAKRIEFMKALRDRMEARKIQMSRWGGHRGTPPK